MAIDPSTLNLIDYNGLSVAFNPDGTWVFSIQSPAPGSNINQLTLNQLAEIIIGSIRLPNGVVSGLNLTVNNGVTPRTVAVSEGQWRFYNTLFTLNDPYISNINPTPSVNRIDAIIGDNTGDVFYQPNFNGTLEPGQILIQSFLVPSDGSDIVPSPTLTVVYAMMNGLNTGDFNITGQFLINGIPFSGGSLNTIEINKTGSDVDIDGVVDISSELTSLSIVVGTFAKTSIYYMDDDQNVYASFNASTQKVSGWSGSETNIKIILSF